MQIKEIIPSLEIIEFLRRYDHKDIAIALMQLELREGSYPISSQDYQKFKTVYESYLTERKYEYLTGVLNEVLQNADIVYEDLKIEHNNISLMDSNKHI